jgi:hypothetical protein
MEKVATTLWTPLEGMIPLRAAPATTRLPGALALIRSSAAVATIVTGESIPRMYWSKALVAEAIASWC